MCLTKSQAITNVLNTVILLLYRLWFYSDLTVKIVYAKPDQGDTAPDTVSSEFGFQMLIQRSFSFLLPKVEIPGTESGTF